ncbi:signal transduction histidine kinase [Curtobacterium sp. PhB42]|uniref:sensor histidine kinase n=1 Tax=unclassified Curtobacterium TaxID=257496 RepID=UPI0010630D25|nr:MULTISPECIES: histidine kinase [unclassified Curtobacterium]TDW48193.1 signal transduction histidine kinase [Curtobacterium sp. PhB42]TDW53966.1 signal transduction histidine kinase [Curtobacterium sp. PhB190]
MASADPRTRTRTSRDGDPRTRPPRDGDPRTRDRRVDVLVALGTAVVALGLLFGLPPLDALEPDGPALALRVPAPFTAAWTVLALGLLVQSAALLAARRAPRTVLVAVSALPVLVAALAPQSLDLFGLTALPVVVAVVLAALRVPLARLWPTLLVAGALVAAGSAVLTGALGQGVLQALGAVGLPLLVTLLVRSRREVRTARTAEASAVFREQDALVDAAVSRERAAMARELHDIAAHHLSGIALMAAVIDRQIDSDPERAHEGARQVREQSTAVLDDLRRLVGLLREDVPAERAVETVAGIVDLVERARFRSDVRLDVLAGDHARGAQALADGVGPLAQLAAYRTVQEALANAALHAPSALCTVTVDDRDPTRVVIRVENARAAAPAAPTSPSGGNGLRGMRERADLVGASLQTGPTATGGWMVELALGREAPAAPAQAADGGEVVA